MRERITPRVVGLVVVITATILLPYFVAPYYVSIARDILIFALFALSIELLLGYVGLPTLGQAGFSGGAAYVAVILLTRYKASAEFAALAGIAGATLLALLFGLLSVRTRGTSFLLITLAEGMIIWGLAVRWTTVTGGFDGIGGIVRPEWLRPYWAYYWFVVAVVLLVFLAVRQVVGSPFGLTLHGIRGSESRMRTLGYGVPLHRLAAFVLSGSIAGLAGVLLVFGSGFISPNSAGLARSAEGLLMVIVGGPGTLIGSLVGAAILVTARNIVSIWTDQWLIILGLGFIFVVLISPRGIVPAVQSIRAKNRRVSRASGSEQTSIDTHNGSR